MIANFLAESLGGKTDDYYNIRGNDNAGSNFVLGTPAPVNRASWDRIHDLKGDYHAVKPYLDVPNLIDICLLWYYGNCESEYRAAGSVDAGSGVKFWLADPDGFLRATSSNRTGNPGPAGLFGALRSENDPDFKVLVADRIYQHFFNDGALTESQSTARLEERMNEIQNSLIAECARWGFQSPASWTSEAEDIKVDHFASRAAQLVSQLRSANVYPAFDPPSFLPMGGLVTSGDEVTFPGASGTIYVTTDGSDPRLPGGGFNPAAQSFGGGTEVTLSPIGATWKYFDTGVDPVGNWTISSFDDSAWASGPAELGYGDGNEATTVSFGGVSNDKHITTWFRRSFNVADASTISELRLRLRRDDGALVYLNGVEILRDNMPSGTITSSTESSSTVGGGNESTYFTFIVPATQLKTGANQLAVEIHQTSETSSDISFDLEVIGIGVAGGGGITITEDTTLRARVWDGSEWSALSEATFLLENRVPAAPGNVFITEVHYNPVGSDDFEFIEVWNPGPDLVDMSGVVLSNGVSFAFQDGFGIPAGEFALIVENSAAFEARYQESNSPYFFDPLRVAGIWSGKLSNDGETVAMLTSNQVSLSTVDYLMELDWPERADGDGASLEVRDPWTLPVSQPALDLLLADGRSWKSSDLFHGSPGRFDTNANQVVINEVLSHTDATIDFIELYNPTPDPVELSGWYIGDDRDEPLRYQIPTPTFLASGAYLQWSTTDLGFGFSELGSDAWLSTASGTNVMRVIDSVDFGAAAREEPFGRFLRSDGRTDFTELLTITPLAANAEPRIGPVVFGELMISPLPGQPEYVELVNISSNTVELFDAANPANTWRLRGGVDFVFPTNTTISSCEPIIICSTNPVAFRAAYGLPVSVPVFGPWTGKLDRAGETLRIEQALDPEPDGFVPYGRVDRISWRSVSPWPVIPVDSGRAIERAPHRAYGNDPAHWWLTAVGGTPSVASDNRLPIVSVSGPVVLEPGTNATWSLSVDDPDAPWQSHSVEMLSLPAGASYNAGNQTIQWNVSPTQPDGLLHLEFKVSDDAACDPAVVTQQVAVVIHDPAGGELLPILPESIAATNVMRIHFPVLAGQHYWIEKTSSLSPPDWQPYQEVVPTSDGLEPVDLPVSSGGPMEYFRIRWVPQ